MSLPHRYSKDILCFRAITSTVAMWRILGKRRVYTLLEGVLGVGRVTIVFHILKNSRR